MSNETTTAGSTPDSYIGRPDAFTVRQWKRDGDHPLVRPYRNPSDSGDRRCDRCTRPMHVHGWIDQETVDLVGPATVCPLDWVIKRHPGLQGLCFVLPPGTFGVLLQVHVAADLPEAPHE